MSRYGRGLAVKINGYRGAAGVGFVLSDAEEKKLDGLRVAILEASKNARRGSNLLSAGLGAVALGLVANGLAKRGDR